MTATQSLGLSETHDWSYTDDARCGSLLVTRQYGSWLEYLSNSLESPDYGDLLGNRKPDDLLAIVMSYSDDNRDEVFLTFITRRFTSTTCVLRETRGTTSLDRVSVSRLGYYAHHVIKYLCVPENLLNYVYFHDKPEIRALAPKVLVAMNEHRQNEMKKAS